MNKYISYWGVPLSIMFGMLLLGQIMIIVGVIGKMLT